MRLLHIEPEGVEMVDNSEEDIFAQFEKETGLADRVYAKAAEYTAYLKERGVDLDLEDPPHDLEAESYEETAEREVRAAARVEMAHEVLMLAKERVIVEVVLEQADAPTESVDEFVQIVRLSMIGNLVHLGLWTDPWKELINREFPGQDPTPEEQTEMVKKSAERLVEEAQSGEVAKERYATIAEFLVLHGYPATDRDILIFLGADLQASYLAANHLSPEATKSEIIAGMGGLSQPDHPVVLELISLVIIPRWFSRS